MVRVLSAAALVGVMTALSACATITRGTTTSWEVRTVPAGASVRTSHGMVCDSTPCSLRMSRKAEFNAVIGKPGYKTMIIAVTHKVRKGGVAGAAGNLLLLGAGTVIGTTADVASGALLDLTPNPAIVILEKDDGSGTPPT